MTSFEMTKEIVNILDNKKADDIQAIKVDDVTVMADYFVIASTTNTSHVKSLVDEVEFVLKQKGIMPKHIEGYQHANWIVLDYSDVIVHIFLEETREYYGLDRLWSDGTVLDINELID